MAHPRALLLRQYCPAIDSGGMSHPDRPDMTAHTLGRKKERQKETVRHMNRNSRGRFRSVLGRDQNDSNEATISLIHH